MQIDYTSKLEENLENPHLINAFFINHSEDRIMNELTIVDGAVFVLNATNPNPINPFTTSRLYQTLRMKLKPIFVIDCVDELIR